MSKQKPPAGFSGPYCMWIYGLDGLLDQADRIQDNPEEKDQISMNRLVTQFSFMLSPSVKAAISTVGAPGLNTRDAKLRRSKDIVLLSWDFDR